MLLTDSGELPQMRVLRERPETARQWQMLIPGAYVWVTPLDRSAGDDGDAHHLGRRSCEALRVFERVASRGPPASRLTSLLGEPRVTQHGCDDDDAVELFYVPQARRD